MRTPADASQGTQMRTPTDAKRWTNLAASLLIILAGGTVYASGAYSEALKRKLHLTQAQLELAALCGNLGNYLGTAGFFYDRYGAVASAKFGATLIGLSLIHI